MLPRPPISTLFPYTTLFRSYFQLRSFYQYKIKAMDAPIVFGDINDTGEQWFVRSAWRYANADRKSTRLNSSHEWISYAVFCLKKKTRRPKSMSESRMGRRNA